MGLGQAALFSLEAIVMPGSITLYLSGSKTVVSLPNRHVASMKTPAPDKCEANPNDVVSCSKPLNTSESLMILANYSLQDSPWQK